jgi:non-ribosomal peptide synthetase-like protein
VLDIETSLGDGAQLGHASSLHAGQAIPNGARRHGSPAQQRTDVNYRAVGAKRGSPLRRVAYVVVQLLTALFMTVPLVTGGVLVLIAMVPQLGALLGPGSPAFPSWIFVGEALAFSFALFFGLILIGLLVMMTVPRVLNLAVRPDKVYPLYGFAYWAHRAIARITNNTFFHHVLGDSSYIVPYLRCLGYDLSEVEQTGSNFGLEVKHETPYLVFIGTGTMSADGLSIINADYSSTSFRVSRASIGAKSFLGNYVAYPSHARAADDCLFATKVMVPVDGHLREGVGLLGSPDFEIPRSVKRDRKFDYLARGDEFRRRLTAKNRHNAVTIGLFLLAAWIFFFELTVVTWIAADLYAAVGASVIALAGVLALALSVAHAVLVERLSTMFRPLEPRYCSIYDPYFWWHERYWKLAVQPSILDGTPFKGLVWRLLGVRIGRRVFDDGSIIMEKTMVAIGDDCALNAGSIIQPHSQENRTFKSDRIAIGAGCTLGIGSLVHYGVTMGDRVELAPDSFLMKGEEVPPHARWGGNPAREIRGEHAAVTTVSGGRSR